MIKNKTIIILTTMILLSTIALSLLNSPFADAQTSSYRTKKTYAYIGATPNPVGVGQETLLHVGITDYLSNVKHGFTGLTVTVTKPDGTTQTLGPFNTDSTGGTGTVYVPSVAGKYYLQTNFPAQWYNWTSTPAFSTNIYGSIWYDKSESEKLELIVQEERVPNYPGSALPTEYWSRPINAQLHEWSTISSNWVTAPDNLVAEDNDAPETAHILWSKALAMGGLAGGKLGDHAFECGDAYEGFFSGSVILGGNLYYNRFNSMGGTRVEQEVVAVDLHTGKELWVRNWNNTRLAFGQVFYWDSWNYHAAFDYLWTTTGSTWDAYDAQTGRWEYRMTNVPSGTTIRGPKDEIYIYTVDQTRGWMTQWNSSRVVQPQTTGGQADGSWIRSNLGTTFDARNGYDWNKTIPIGLPGTVRNAFFEDRIIGSNAVGWMTMGDLPVATWCLNLKPGLEGQLMFNVSWSPPKGDYTFAWGTSYGGVPSIKDKVFIISSKEDRNHYGFSLDTGQLLWGPTEKQNYLDIYGMATLIADGKLISARMGGIVYAYDIKTGKTLWTYEATDHYNEILWGNNWPIRPMFVSDGKIYLGHSEHSPVDPKPRGAPYVCLDLETGKEVWRIDGAFRVTDWGGRSIIGDSIIATYDSYDQQIYAIGKGPSAMTVSVSPKVTMFGSSVMIEGTVTDVSPGTKSDILSMRFRNGVPAVSDDSMSEWMKYVYLQFERPLNTKGVPISFSVVDANGNYRDIGSTTSDADGFFAFNWKPDIEGQYTVYASFVGSKAYYPSHAVTSFAIDTAAPTTAPTVAPLTSISDAYFIPAVAGIFVAIAIVGAIIVLLLLKKRP